MSHTFTIKHICTQQWSHLQQVIYYVCVIELGGERIELYCERGLCTPYKRHCPTKDGPNRRDKIEREREREREREVS